MLVLLLPSPMAKVAITSYTVPTIRGQAGGVGAFTARWASLLRKAGHDVTIVMTRVDWEPMRVDAAWRARYQAEGIGLIELQAPRPTETRWPEIATMRMAEIAAPVLRGFDIVYFQDWGNTAFHLVRERRYAADQGPVCVTVLHGPSEWELATNQKYPSLPGDLHLAWQERYAARHSDFVVSPTRYMTQYLSDLGWEFPAAVETLGLPMPEPAPAAAPVCERIRRIVCFGRVEERKGIRNFARALEYLAKATEERPAVVLLGATKDQSLLEFALHRIAAAGFAVSHEGSLDTLAADAYLRRHAADTLCVVPSPADNHPYAIVEASLVPGLNLIAGNGGGVPEVLAHAEGQLCAPLPRDLAAKIAERLRTPLRAEELARYDCAAANARWLDFHHRALEARSSRIVRSLPDRSPSVDVCITYFQKPDYLGQVVDALERQTTQDFHVIAVNDGSPDQESNRVFEEQAARVRGRGWDFYRQENAFVDAARNSAARRGDSEYILFIDADDVPALNSVERMREAIVRSGDDALICSCYLFASDGPPFDLTTGEPRVPPYAIRIPLGMDLVGGLINPSAFGGSMFIVRRSAFEAIGGFRELRGAGHEDWELYVRLALAGARMDVLPDLLHYYRQVDGSLARTMPAENARRRLLDAYEQQLSSMGLSGAALALDGLHRRSKELEGHIRLLSARSDPPQARFAFFSGARQRFETDGEGVSRLQALYRRTLSLETRLKIHRIVLAPFLGPYRPPHA